MSERRPLPTIPERDKPLSDRETREEMVKYLIDCGYTREWAEQQAGAAAVRVNRKSGYVIH
jgi:hypothetical protein